MQNSNVVTFHPQFAEAFRALNLEWIETHFQVEQKDLERVGVPADCVASAGKYFCEMKKPLR